MTGAWRTLRDRVVDSGYVGWFWYGHGQEIREPLFRRLLTLHYLRRSWARGRKR